MIALVMALGLCAAMAGCNSSEESSSTADSGSSAVAEKTDSVPAETVGSESSDSVQETEAPAEDNSALYAYYDELAAEFEKEGDNSYKLLTTDSIILNHYNIIFENDKVLWFGCEGVGRDKSHILYSYDINTKETREQAFYNGFELNNIYYHDGYIYASYDDDNTTYKFNIEENTVTTLNKAYGEFYITPSGHIVASAEDGFELISPDLQTITKIPALTNADSHGLEQEVNISINNFLGSYNDRIYAGFFNSNEYHIAYLDVNDMSWHKTAVFYDDTEIGTMNRGKTVGKYMIFQIWDGGETNTVIYNMETDEILVENIDTPEYWDPFAQSYYGGNSNIYQIKNTEDGQYYFYQVQHPSDGSMIDLSKSFQLGVESSNGSNSLYFLNDTYYAFKDDAGLFLRTYEKGETEEEIIYVFEN